MILLSMDMHEKEFRAHATRWLMCVSNYNQNKESTKEETMKCRKNRQRENKDILTKTTNKMFLLFFKFLLSFFNNPGRDVRELSCSQRRERRINDVAQDMGGTDTFVCLNHTNSIPTSFHVYQRTTSQCVEHKGY